jgi:hypothetical protein
MAIESGQVNKKYPLENGRRVVISIALKFEPNEIGKLFLSNVKKILLNEGYDLDYYVFDK